MLRKIKGLMREAAFCGLLAIAGIGSLAAAVPESKDPIKLVMMGYSGDNIIMLIYGKLLQKLGYTVEWTPADYLGQFAGLGPCELLARFANLRRKPRQVHRRVNLFLGAAGDVVRRLRIAKIGVLRLNVRGCAWVS